MIRLGLHQNRTAFVPGELIAGAAQWKSGEAFSAAEVRLCWFTRGKGSPDSAVVAKQILADPQLGDVREFSFVAPAAPYSFSGRLLSVLWTVELLLQPGNRFQRVPITIGPAKAEVLLPSAAATAVPRKRRGGRRK